MLLWKFNHIYFLMFKNVISIHMHSFFVDNKQFFHNLFHVENAVT